MLMCLYILHSCMPLCICISLYNIYICVCKRLHIYYVYHVYNVDVPGRTLRNGPFIFCNVFEISEHMRKLLRSTCLCCQMLPKVPVAQPLNSFIVLFWRIEKRSSVYHVLRHVGDQRNSIRIFAVKIAQDCVPYQHSTN